MTAEAENVQQRILGHFGQSGSGKTYALEQDTLDRHEDEGRRIFVYDYKREWGTVPDGLACEACLERPPADSAERLVWERQKCMAPRQCIIVPDRHTAFKRFLEVGYAVYRPRRDMRIGPPAKKEIPEIEHVAFWVLNTCSCDLVLPEAHIHLPLEDDTSMGVQTRQLITQYRDYDVAISYDTQQFASVSMKLRKQTNAMRLFGFPDATPDMKQVQNLGGAALVDCIIECATRHAKGNPGWHVYVDPRIPPVNPKIARY